MLLLNYQESVCEDIMDHLNNVLSFPSLFSSFKGAQASLLIDIVHVDINQDFSHVTAYWKSPVVSNFVSFARNETDDVAAAKLATRLSTKLTNKLQNREALFRSELLKKMSFRRVPRIFFRPVFERK
jgi:hypothetical protein